jgi:hypothetical protein
VDEGGEELDEVVEGEQRCPFVDPVTAATAGAVEEAGQLGEEQALDTRQEALDGALQMGRVGWKGGGRGR